MPFIPREERFSCGHCGRDVLPLGSGTYRNHCPFCLWSKHVDAAGPGDRSSVCQGLMEPISSEHDAKKGGWMILHRCVKCGKTIPNKLAPDDDGDMFLAIHPRGA